jgi:hypothetical protein
MTGTVPRDAVTALFGLRVNTECQCSGFAHVTLGPAEYRDGVTEKAFVRVLGPGPERLIVARPDQVISQNSSTFPVIPGHAYTANTWTQASADTQGSGHLALIFLGQDGRQVASNQIPFEASTRFAGEVRTDTRGRFSFRPTPDIRRLGASYILEFPGDDVHRLDRILLH